jgi:putative membrane protein
MSTQFQPQLRLHPLSWLFHLTGSIRQAIVPLIALFVFGSRGDGNDPSAYLLPVLLGLLLVHALWVQWTFRYDFAPNGLVIREGVLFRNLRQIDYSRIENIDTERGVLHRLLGLAQVSVQTSTGGKPEALIRVLDLAAVQRMREQVFEHGKSAEAGAEPIAEEVLLRLPSSELIRFGLIDNRGMIIVAAGAGVLHEFGLFNIDREIVYAWLQASPLALVAALGIVMQVALAVAAIVSALLAVRVLSVVLALVTLHDFTLARAGTDMRARYGLLTRISLTLRTARIQSVHQTESVLHRLFGRVSLRADLTGDSGSSNEQREEGKSKTRWLAPVCEPQVADDLLIASLPEVRLDDLHDWQPLAPGARRRVLRRSAFLWLLLATAPAVWYLREWSALPLALGLLGCWIHAREYVRRTHYAWGAEALAYRRGWLTRELTIVPRNRVQSVLVQSSPFDRRSDMATLCIDTAGSSAVRIPYLQAATAQSLARSLYRQADDVPLEQSLRLAPLSS